MSQGREILRRLLLAVGALVAFMGFIYGAVVAFDGAPENRPGGAIGMLCAVAAFYGWRATVNWVLLYEKPPEPFDAEF